MSRNVVATALVAACLAAVSLVAPPVEGKGVVAGPVYFGNPKNYLKPGEISLVKVWWVIPEVKKLKDDNIDETNPNYWILLQKANKKFKAALKAVSRRFGYDLIGELKFIRGEEKVPDITAEVVLEIKGKGKRKSKEADK